MSDDLISRQAAVYAVDEMSYAFNVKTNAHMAFIKALADLPSAERTGRWEWEGFNIVCSECDYSPCFDSTEPLYHFCPNCGAQMDLEEEDG